MLGNFVPVMLLHEEVCYLFSKMTFMWQCPFESFSFEMLCPSVLHSNFVWMYGEFLRVMYQLALFFTVTYRGPFSLVVVVSACTIYTVCLLVCFSLTFDSSN